MLLLLLPQSMLFPGAICGSFELVLMQLTKTFLHNFLLCRENCGEKMEEFLNRCFYHCGQYDSQEHFGELDKKLKEQEVINVCRLQLFSIC